MKVWRVISLTLWGIVLFGLLIVSVGYFTLDQSVMNQTKMKQALESHSTYKIVRTEQVIPQFMGRSPVDLDDTGVLTQSDLLKALEQVFNEQKVKNLSEQVVDIMYEWLNKKRPDLTFSFDLSQEKQQLLADLSGRVVANAQKLPDCTDTFPDTDELREFTCIPYYTDATTIASSVNAELASSFENLDITLTSDDVGLTARQLGALVNLPDYYGYLWALNLVTLPLAGLLALYLLIKRRGTGVIAIGAAVLVSATALLVGGHTIDRFVSHSDPMVHAILQAAYEVIGETINLFTLIGLTSGIILITLGILLVLRKRQLQQVDKQGKALTPEEPEKIETRRDRG